MQLIRYPQYQPTKLSSCVTIGNFDGVHMGHQALISQVVQQAKQSGRQSVVVTMQPLPLQYFNDPYAVEILTPFKHKFLAFSDLGVDVMCLLNFNHRLAAMTATEFYQNIIRDGLKADCILVGDDFRFGANRQGDFAMLQTMADSDGIEVQRLNTIIMNGQRVSSTAIRQGLKAADFALAKAMLGRDFNVIGRVAHGRKIGRTIGYPTINLELKQGAFPLHGIYVVEINIAGHWYPAVGSVGFNPSVGGNAKRIEVYVLDFDQQVYGQCVEVLFYKKLRNEVEFDSLNALTSAIDDDVRLTRAFFAKNNAK
jgi:riboflavin kinase/FMN adenylyltransferase